MHSKAMVVFSLFMLHAAAAPAVNLNLLPRLDNLTYQSLFDNVNLLLADRQDEDGQFEFRPGKAEFAPGDESRASALAQIINAYSSALKEAFPKLRVVAEAHTDAEGTPEAVHNLTIARAKAVCRALRAGALKLRCVPIGAGASMPVVYPAVTQADRQANQRVMVQLVK
jgi:outer membrane protein OmpA-like peptidoglycan-associated protein